MKRSEAIRKIVTDHEGALVFSNGLTSRTAQAVAHRPGNLYLLHAMGESQSVAKGIASAMPHLSVTCVRGDGEALMGRAGEHVQPDIHTHTLANGMYETTGGQPLPHPVWTDPIEPDDQKYPIPGDPKANVREFMAWLEQRRTQCES